MLFGSLEWNLAVLEALLPLLNELELLMVVFICLLKVFSRKLPVVHDDVLAALVKHHADIFAKVAIILKYFMKPKQRVDLVVLLQQVLLERLYQRIAYSLLAKADFHATGRVLARVYP